MCRNGMKSAGKSLLALANAYLLHGGMNAQHRVEIGLVKLSCEGGKKFSDCNLQIEYPFFYAPLDQRASFM